MTTMTMPPIVREKRGAIMVLGIFFACVMIGWMWMLVGLGDAMIWRDRSQEAADAIAYSSAALEAKGMNIISFINVILMILAGVYLVLALIFNILDLLHVILGKSGDDKWWEIEDSCGIRADDSEIVGAGLDLVGLEPIGALFAELGAYWCDAADAVSAMWSTAYDALRTYEDDVMKPVMPALSTFEDIVAYGTPWVGAAVGAYVGYKYQDFGVNRLGAPIGASLFPATTTPGQAGNLFSFAPKYKAEEDKNCEKAATADQCQKYNGGDKREGLPVEIPDDGMSALCKAAASTAVEPIKKVFKNIPVVSTIVNWLLDGFADGLEDAYCKMDSKGIFPWDGTLSTALHISDNLQDSAGGPSPQHGLYRIKKNGEDFWENPIQIGGPHTVVGYASNGSDWMQSWAFVFAMNRPEKSEKLVGVASMDSSGPGSTWNKIIPQNSDTKFTLFMAQAEFYYDCGDEEEHPIWSDEECNGGTNDGSLASYEMNWRARLRRIHGLSFTSDLFNYLWGGWLNSGFDSKALQFLKGGEEGKIKQVGQQFGGWLNDTAVTGAYGALKDWAGNQLGGMINPATSLPDTIH